MEKIIQAISKELLVQELTDDKFLRHTNFGNNHLYIITHHDSPNVMREIGRLRELAFRTAGGGTGKEIDIDNYDICKNPYKQLIVWDPSTQEIIGGYRFQECNSEKHSYKLATEKLFNFSEEFKKNYLPYTIELGRSFIQPSHQSTGPLRKTLYALDNLWDGLGSLIIDNPHIKYLFGKVTMYTHYNKEARNILLSFLDKYFPDEKNLVTAKKTLDLENNKGEINKIFTGKDFAENSKILSKKVRELGENVPPLINAYMNLSSTMKVFGTTINESFGKVEETGIMITIKDVYPKKVERYFDPYIQEKKNQELNK
ncbi:MAG: GNAT family N-acetyltransferase [Bacteroidota bacterium]|nr:GNAT family N-acetyltransferase [Bacteroidota bacterium]